MNMIVKTSHIPNRNPFTNYFCYISITLILLQIVYLNMFMKTRYAYHFTCFTYLSNIMYSILQSDPFRKRKICSVFFRTERVVNLRIFHGFCHVNSCSSDVKTGFLNIPFNFHFSSICSLRPGMLRGDSINYLNTRGH